MEIWDLFGLRYKSHPWHGIDIGDEAPDRVNVFIEIVPTDTVKYEIDKASGYLKVDRPQKFSNIVPTLYGFIPRTYCAEEVATYCMKKCEREGIVGDSDPLDICVFTERQITHGGLLVKAQVIGGFRMIDGGEADDKIIATLAGDEVYKDWKDITDCPPAMVERLRHYFLTYKEMPGRENVRCEITHVYGASEARDVIRASQKDYETHYGQLESRLSQAVADSLARKLTGG